MSVPCPTAWNDVGQFPGSPGTNMLIPRSGRCIPLVWEHGSASGVDYGFPELFFLPGGVGGFMMINGSSFLLGGVWCWIYWLLM